MTRSPSRPPASVAPPITGRPPGPDPGRLAGLLTRVWLEVRAGRRPLNQLAPLVAPAVLRRLVAQLERATDTGHVPRLRRVTATRPRPDACEASVTVEDCHGRTTAFAVRLERHRGCWRAVELTPPEAGLPALPTASLPIDHRPRDAFDEVLEDEHDGR